MKHSIRSLIVAPLALSTSAFSFSSTFIAHHHGAVSAPSTFLPSPSASAFGVATTFHRRGRGRRRTTYSASPTQLCMMFDQLSSALSEITSAFSGKQRITENSIAPALKSVRRALLDADVNIDVATTLIEGVKKRSLGMEIIKGVTPEQQFVKAMYDELLDMMGGESSGAVGGGMGMGSSPTATLAYNDDSATNNPTVILLAGLQGAGKTTAAGKLALYLKEREIDSIAVSKMSDEDRSQTLASRLPKRQRKVLLVAADVYRPAAIQQLEILGNSIDVTVFSMGVDVDPATIAKEAVEKAKREGYDTVLVDTAGRQVVDEELMEELRRVKRTGK